MSVLKWHFVGEGKAKVAIEITGGMTEITAPDLEQAALEIAAIRHQMVPPVPATLGRPTNLRNPTLVSLGRDMTMQIGYLSIRDTGLGWLYYRLSDDQLRNLQAQIEQHFAAGGQGSANA